MNQNTSPRRAVHSNALLASLPPGDFEDILPSLELVFLKRGKVMHDSGDRSDCAYFPTTAVITLHYLTADGRTVGTGIIGNEGMLGVELFMGGHSTPNRAVVQSAGNAFRMSASALKAEFAANHEFRGSLLRYTQALITQVSQTAVCNRLHSVQQQLARWLLDSLDRAEADRLVLTHEQIARVLGVRRESVTIGIEKLSELGFVKNVRGIVKMVDRRGLEFAACECYQAVTDEYDRLVRPKDLLNSRSVAVGMTAPLPRHAVAGF